MKTHLLIALAASAIFTQAHAGQIYLGESQGVLPNSVWANFGAILYSDNGADFAYSLLGNPVKSIDSRTSVPATIDGQKFRYTLTNVVNQGVSFTLNPLDTPSSFSFHSIPAPYWVSAGYNVLDIRAYSAGGKTISLENLSFTISPSFQVNGSFSPASLTSQSGETSYRFLASINDDGSAADLSTIGWTFGADVTLLPSPAGTAYFSVTATSGNFTPTPGSGTPVAVPETSTWVMGFLAFGVAVFLARRKTNRQPL